MKNWTLNIFYYEIYKEYWDSSKSLEFGPKNVHIPGNLISVAPPIFTKKKTKISDINTNAPIGI